MRPELYHKESLYQQAQKEPQSHFPVAFTSLVQYGLFPFLNPNEN
jgi:hypothetical protein